MSGLITSIVALIGVSRYGLLFLGVLVGSPVVMLAAGYLIHAHQFDFLAAYLTIVSADLVGDVGWYWAGRFGARPFLLKYGHYFGISEKLIERLEARFLRYHELILIINKLTMGFGLAIATLAVAGMMRVPFFRYLALNITGELIWALIPIGIGYYFGNVIDYFPLSVRWIFFLGSLVGAFFLLRYLLKRLARSEW